jgi:hypothetical protein
VKLNTRRNQGTICSQLERLEICARYALLSKLTYSFCLLCRVLRMSRAIKLSMTKQVSNDINLLIHHLV